jgi:hypothetical protein
MREHFVAKRAWLWARLGAALGLGIVLYTGEKARAIEGPESESQAGETVATARALVARLEAQLLSTESSLQKARELLAKLEGEGPHRQPAAEGVTTLGKPTGTDLVGFWRLVGSRKRGGDEYLKPSYDMYRIMTSEHFLNFPFDPNTGKVLDWAWGSYSEKDGTYTGHYDYSNSEAIQAIVGKEHKFTDRIAGDRWYHSGTTATGQWFDDLYIRVNKSELARLEGERPPRQPTPGRLGNLREANVDDVVGLWRLVGERKGEGDEFHKPPYELIRAMTPDRYQYISFDPNTGKDCHWAGGTYSLKNGTYTGHMEFTDREDLRPIIGKEYKFTCKIEGDRLWHFAGTLPNGVKQDNLWERINVPH